jgi:hypothetical protein
MCGNHRKCQDPDIAEPVIGGALAPTPLADPGWARFARSLAVIASNAKQSISRQAQAAGLLRRKGSSQ